MLQSNELVNCKFIRGLRNACITDLGICFGDVSQLLGLCDRDLFSPYELKSCRLDKSLVSRYLIKMLVCSKYSWLRPRNVEIVNNSNGKPQLRICGCDLPWVISISHSRDVVAICFSDDGAVGIDVQTPIKWDIPLKLDIAFTSCELDCIFSDYDPEKRNEMFTLLWTIKEAVGKALGVGLMMGFHSIEVLPLENECCRVRLRGIEHKKICNSTIYYDCFCSYICAVFWTAGSTGEEDKNRII